MSGPCRPLSHQRHGMGKRAGAEVPSVAQGALVPAMIQRAPILGIEPVQGGGPDTLAFAVELDIDHETAQRMADRRRDGFFKGRRTTVKEVDG